MKRKLIVLSLLVFCVFSAYSQITIEECYEKARTNYPLIKQGGLIEKSKEYNLSNAAKGYLPQIMFSAKASYQSEVTKIPINIQGIDIKGLSKDQYGLTMEVDQTIWDGGAIKSHEADIRTASEVSQRSLDVNMYAIRERINQMFFGALLVDAQIKENDLYQEDLSKNYDKVSSYVRNGIAHKADLDAVKVEQLKAKQSRVQLVYARNAYIEMLSTFIGEQLSNDVQLVKPSLSQSSQNSINRPELALYDAQIQNYEAKRQSIKASLMPRIGLFVTGGYGRPGLNMLNNDFSAYYIGGVRLTWNLSNLYTKKNDRNLINTNISAVQAQKETFLLNTRIDMTKKERDIDNYKEQLKYDDEIIALRGSVKHSSETKMADGTLSGIDLVRDINAENLAKLDKVMHEINMLYAMYNLKTIVNN